MEKIGYVYILTNPSFKEDWVKIGKSSRPVDIRSKELDNTAVPLPFEIFATMKTVKYHEVEKHIHKTIDRLTDLRIRQNREFFNVAPEMALNIFKDVAAIIDDAIIEEYSNELSSCDEGVEEDIVRSKPRSRFRFSMINIPIGATVVFTPTDLDVKVASDNQIEYEGRLYKLSAFVGTFMPENKRNISGAYQGAKYFTYNGELLSKLRDQSNYDFYDDLDVDRNYDKYKYNGNVYNKGGLVNVIIRDYVSNHQGLSFSTLESIFYRKIQGSNGCFDRLEKAEEIQRRDRRRHRLGVDEIIHLRDCEIATSTQWNKNNIQTFINVAVKLGFVIQTIVE